MARKFWGALGRNWAHINVARGGGLRGSESGPSPSEYSKQKRTFKISKNDLKNVEDLEIIAAVYVLVDGNNYCSICFGI